MNVSWSGVFPALTTQFKRDASLDLTGMEKHYAGQLQAGVHGLVALGSLGENAALTRDEKLEVLRLAISVASRRVPVLAGVAETTTAAAVDFVKLASRLGVAGFMVLPPMQYVSDRRETVHHLRAIAAASDKPIMLYNNPVAYRVDVTPDMFAELADEPKFVAIKESSEDVRRVTDIKNLVGDRYAIFIGVDDLMLESFAAGAIGWVAGLVCAFPEESVVLYKLLRAKRMEEALTLYRWFIPLLHLDASIKFVQYIKLAQSMTGNGSEYVRPPRLPLVGEERARIERIIEQAIAHRPATPKI